MADAPANNTSYPTSTDVMPILNRVNTPAPTPAPAVPTSDPDATAATGAVTQVAGAPAAAPTPTPGQTVADNPHGKIGTVLQDIAGGKTTDYVQTPKGPVPIKRNLQPGEIARNILASAFSLLSAGTGGDLAAREKRPYVQPADQTIGGMENERVANREQQANQVYQNQRQATADTLAGQKAAQESQESMARTAESQANARKISQSISEGDLDIQGKQQALLQQAADQHKKDNDNWASYMSEPGAEVAKDAQGNPLAFYDTGVPGQPGFVSAGTKAKQYAVLHPEIIHGSTDGSAANKYGIAVATNPVTGALQIIDYAPDRNTKVLYYEGQAIDPKTGKGEFDKNNEPVPNTDPSKGRVYYDPVTHKPTVLTSTITAVQSREIQAQQAAIRDANARASDSEQQAAMRDAQIKALPELNDAYEVYNSKGVNALTAKQRNMLATMYGRQLTDNRIRLSNAETALNTAKKNASADTGADVSKDPDVVAATNDFNQAKANYDDINGSYSELTGLTPGTKLANSLIRNTNFNTVKWSDIDKQITNTGLPADEQKAARAKVWNSMSPAQQQAARGNTPQQAQPNAPAKEAPTKTTTVNGQKMDVVYDATGAPHGIPLGTADEFIADPTHKGWHK